MLKNDPIGQHDLPKTYLKNFSINPNDRKLKSFIYCFWENEYNPDNSKAKMISIDSDRFKKDNFYTNNEYKNPFAFEDFFKNEIEPLYNKIIIEVEKESNLTLDCRQNLMFWLFYNKYRNKAFRDVLEDNLNFYTEVLSRMNAENKEVLKEKEYILETSKKLQLEILKNVDLFLDFQVGMGTKHWLIIKSRPNNQFITNDNPGFSINIDEGHIDFSTLNSSFATNHNATNYFILSPKYCLIVSPFWEDTPIEESLNNQIISFLIAGNKQINFINYCTGITKTKYLISNDKVLIDKHIRERNTNWCFSSVARFQ